MCFFCVIHNKIAIVISTLIQISLQHCNKAVLRPCADKLGPRLSKTTPELQAGCILSVDAASHWPSWNLPSAQCLWWRGHLAAHLIQSLLYFSPLSGIWSGAVLEVLRVLYTFRLTACSPGKGVIIWMHSSELRIECFYNHVNARLSLRTRESYSGEQQNYY